MILALDLVLRVRLQLVLLLLPERAIVVVIAIVVLLMVLVAALVARLVCCFVALAASRALAAHPPPVEDALGVELVHGHEVALVEHDVGELAAYGVERVRLVHLVEHELDGVARLDHVERLEQLAQVVLLGGEPRGQQLAAARLDHTALVVLERVAQYEQALLDVDELDEHLLAEYDERLAAHERVRIAHTVDDLGQRLLAEGDVRERLVAHLPVRIVVEHEDEHLDDAALAIVRILEAIDGRYGLHDHARVDVAQALEQSVAQPLEHVLVDALVVAHGAHDARDDLTGAVADGVEARAARLDQLIEQLGEKDVAVVFFVDLRLFLLDIHGRASGWRRRWLLAALAQRGRERGDELDYVVHVRILGHAHHRPEHDVHELVEELLESDLASQIKAIY